MAKANTSPSWTRRNFLTSGVGAAAVCVASSGEGQVQVLSAPSGGIQPQIALVQDEIHLVYFAGDPKHGDIFYVRSDNFGRSFSPPIRVNSQEGSAIAIGAIRGAQISVGKRNRVHVAWNGSDLAEPRGPVNPESGKLGSPMLYARLNDRGTAFEPQRNLMQNTFGLDGGGSVAADGAGNVYMGWHGKAPGAAEGEAGRRVWIAKSHDEGRSFAKELPATEEPTGVCGCCGLRLFVDSRGEIYGLYRSAKENVHRDIYLLRSGDAGTTFSVALIHPWNVNACPMSSMAFTEAAGEVLAAWETQTQVYLALVARAASVAKGAILQPPGENPKRKYPALARNRRGETLLAWVDGAGWQRAGTLGWQIFDQHGNPSEACRVRRNVPMWSFPAVFARPDGGFAIIV